jgi:D-inositol-3-phosphate glycosyltransferase
VPRVLMEAAAMDVPLIATDIPGCREVIDGEDVGLLVPVRDPDAFAAATDALLADPALAAAMGADAAARARTFTWSTTAARLRRLYADLTARALVDCTR